MRHPLGVALVSLAVLVLPTTSWSANHYVRAAATGNGSGSDWTNAYTKLPASLVRGDTYYVAAGAYLGLHDFNDTESGTSVITVKAATVSDHGTSTGWSDGFVGQAVFQRSETITALVWVFHKGYYTIDGVYGCGPTATCGFQLDSSQYNVSSGCSGSTTIQVEPGVASHLTFQYLEVKGTANTSGSSPVLDSGIWLRGGNTDFLLSHLWVHDQGASWVLLDGLDTATIEYSWFRNNHSTPACHQAGVIFRVGPNKNITVRYNRLENADGTAYIDTTVNGGLTGPISSNWYFYGNVFFYNAAESNGQAKAAGVAQIFAVRIAGNLSFYNNTFSALDAGPLNSGICRILFPEGASTTSVALLTVQNNIWYNCAQAVSPPAAGSSGITTVVWDHNAYFAMPSSGSGNPSEQNASGNPFRNVAQSPGANDFHLTRDTSQMGPLGLLYNLDPDGVTRTSSRGAFQFGPLSRPNPPPNLNVR